LKDVGELPSMEEFEKLVAESFQADLIPAAEETPPEPVSESTSDPGDQERQTAAQVVEMPVRTGTE